MDCKCNATMGVGNGSGQLFVHGDYDSIKAAQGIVDEGVVLRKANYDLGQVNKKLKEEATTLRKRANMITDCLSDKAAADSNIVFLEMCVQQLNEKNETLTTENTLLKSRDTNFTKAFKDSKDARRASSSDFLLGWCKDQLEGEKGKVKNKSILIDNITEHLES